MTKSVQLLALVSAGMALIEQIENSDYKDMELGHSLDLNKDFVDFKHLVSMHYVQGVPSEIEQMSQSSSSTYGSWEPEERILEPVVGKVVISFDEYERRLNHTQEIVHHVNAPYAQFAPNEVIMPTYMTEKAVGADCFASTTVTINPGEVKGVPIGIKAKFDGDLEGLFAFVRSSIPGKMKLMLANGVGVIEEDYHGNPKNDGEIGFMFYNFGKYAVTINRFDRIGQLVLAPISRFDNAGRAGMERGASGSTNK
jgi:dUTP pyrophosphatase